MKFVGSRAQFQGFLNQVRLVLKMHTTQYLIDATQVGLGKTLKTSITIAWFVSLLKIRSPLSHIFDVFIKEFQYGFGDIDSLKLGLISTFLHV